jgi:hypothetical protein
MGPHPAVGHARRPSSHGAQLVQRLALDLTRSAVTPRYAAGTLDKTAQLAEVVVVDLLRFAGRRREHEREDRLAIADKLHITIRTERNHVANILAKLR